MGLVLSRIWAKKGTRPRVVRQQQFISGYLFGAVCPAKQKAAGLVMPNANTQGMQHHLEVISAQVEQGCHALLIVDRAAWHTTPKLTIPDNMTLLPLPPYSPELNPVEQVWLQLRQSYFSNRCFEGYEDIVEVCCKAWNAFAEAPMLIKSLCTRKWATLE